MRPQSRINDTLDGSRLLWAVLTLATLGGALYLILKG